MKTHIIKIEESEAMKAAVKQNKVKRVDKRLQVIILRYEGMKKCDIGEKLGCHRQCVSYLCSEFKCKRMLEYTTRKCGGNNRLQSVEEENAILDHFCQKQKKGDHNCPDDQSSF